jgi:RNase P/RNase MRP subunit p30
MTRVNVYLPDDLAARARAAGLNVSGLTQEAIRQALAVTRVDAWLDGLADLPPLGIGHEAVMAAVEEAKGDLETRG